MAETSASIPSHPVTASQDVGTLMGREVDQDMVSGATREAPTDDLPQYITFQPNIYAKVLDLIPAGAPQRILDLGAGQGYLSRKLKDLGHRVEACDFLEEEFKCADIPFVKTDLNERFPVPDASYDIVISVEVIEHIENHFRFMQEAVRVTRPGGMIIITTPNVLSLPSRWHLFLYGYTDCAPLPLDPTREEYFLQHINPISLPELIFHFERAGAELEKLTTNRLRRGAWIPMLLLYPLLALAMRIRLMHSKYAEFHELHRRHRRWMLTPANLMGRITIAVGRKAGAKG